MYEPNLNLLVALIVQEQGNASKQEIKDFLEKHDELKVTIDDAKLDLILSQLTDKDVLTKFQKAKETRWKIQRIPPSFRSLKMINVVQMKKTEAKDYVKAMEGERIGPEPTYRNFRTVKMTFETVDHVAGGIITEQDGKLTFPRKQDKLIIPANWIYGLWRDNAPLLNLPPATKLHIAWGIGEVEENTKTALIVKTSHVRGRGLGRIQYEVLPIGTKFTIIGRFPMKGMKAIHTVEDIKNFYKLIEVAPIRGLGANPRAFGGRIKLLEIVEVDNFTLLPTAQT